MGAHGPVFEADGAPRLNAQGKPLIRTWLFPLDQAERHDVWNPIGLRGTASDSYTVRDLFVPEAFSSTREHSEEREISGPLYAFTMQGLYAVGVAGVALGLARAGCSGRVLSVLYHGQKAECRNARTSTCGVVQHPAIVCAGCVLCTNTATAGQGLVAEARV